MSKDLKPKVRLGQSASGNRKRAIFMVLTIAALAAGGYSAYRYTGQTKVEVPVARVRQSEFVISVRTRGEVRSSRSVILSAPQIPDPRIVMLAESGKPIRKGETVIEFDAAQQEQYYLDRATSVRTVDKEIVQMQASHRITKEMDAMNQMTAGYNVDRAKLEASKAEILSEIEGKKNRIDVGTAEGDLDQVNVTVKAHKTTQQADLDRLDNKKDKTVRDVERAKGYLSRMKIVAPMDGIVNVLPNTRTQGSFGSTPPPFKEGDRAWTGAAIAEIPDLSQMRVELKLLQRRIGASILFVTHDQSEAMAISDRIAVMRSGKVEQIGSPLELYTKPVVPFVRDFLGHTLKLPGRIVGRDGQGVRVDLGNGVGLTVGGMNHLTGSADRRVVQAKHVALCVSHCVPAVGLTGD